MQDGQTDISPDEDSAAVAAAAIAVLRASLESIIVIDHESHILEWNASAENTFGYLRRDALGHDLAELIIPPDLRPAHKAGIKHFLATGVGPVINRRIEIRGMRRGGEVFPVELTVVPIDATPPRFAAYVRDITERKRSEQALERSEERFRSLVEATSEIVWLCDSHGAFAEPQPAWTAFTGTDFDHLKAWGWLGDLHPDDRAFVTEKWTEAVGSQHVYQVEYRLLRRDGEYRIVSVRAVPVCEGDNQNDLVREWIGVSVDVTERREAEDERKKQAAEHRRFVREMLASVTEGRLCLCDSNSDLPDPVALATAPVPLSAPTLRTLRARLTEVATAMKMPPDRLQDLLIAAGEASMNAVKHGGGGAARICADSKKGMIQVWIEDHGRGIRQEDLHRATLEKGWSGGNSLGHGFFLMLRTCDRTYLRTGLEGTIVVLEQEQIPPQPAWLQNPMS